VECCLPYRLNNQGFGWDEEIWEEICTMLIDNVWVEQQLNAELSQSADLEKLITMEQFKISQVKLRNGKVQ